jgi:hypothetical protein
LVGFRAQIVDAAHGGWLLVEDLAGTRGCGMRAIRYVKRLLRNLLQS